MGKKFCVYHGGGKRCCVDGCTNSALTGGELKCAAHGGGKRCATDGCHKLAVKDNKGVSMHCVAHGGGKRCLFQGCERTALKRTNRKYCKVHHREHQPDPAAESSRKRIALDPLFSKQCDDPHAEHVALAVSKIVAMR
jgi:hypothetical protein